MIKVILAGMIALTLSPSGNCETLDENTEMLTSVVGTVVYIEGSSEGMVIELDSKVPGGKRCFRGPYGVFSIKKQDHHLALIAATSFGETIRLRAEYNNKSPLCFASHISKLKSE